MPRWRSRAGRAIIGESRTGRANETHNANETREPNTARENTMAQYAKRIGTGNGRTFVGLAGAVRIVGTGDDRKVVIAGARGTNGKPAATVARVGSESFQTSVTLNAGESAALIAAIAGDTLPSLSADWKRFVSSVTGATATGDGFRLTLPSVPKPPRKRNGKTPVTVDTSDANVAARLAAMLAG
jgi:hypothetical protein